MKRIYRTHRKGGGFEAAGTLGQSHYTRKARRARRPLFRPVITMLIVIIAFKAAVLANIGAGSYTSRIDALKAGSFGERVAAQIMAADPLTVMVASWMRPIFN
ncbi:hypothetical protein IV417_15395 [Alphaproteobacteria bacterium KMM 3653]|uniref:Uncharacterized protein n=1 Tax=Harenicola maris TaxID=2841044 RepID=A0AAP2CQP6_9RHOB|nr:hypothetical protein [Harenicola maris]